MGVEIERKFKLKSKDILAGYEGSHIVQGYLADKPVTVRVRVMAGQGFLTVKGMSQGASRAEFEYPIPASDAQAMLELPGTHKLEKTRFEIPHQGFVFEVDQYHGPLEGLFTVEVELPHVDAKVSLPDWVGEELTGQRAWDNSALAQFGRP